MTTPHTVLVAPGRYRLATPEEAAQLQAASAAQAAARAVPLALPCVHLGADTGTLVPCESCKGTQLKTFACARHGRCTLAKKAVGVACCATCPDREPRFRRHLLYHLYPRRGSSWRWHCLKLLEHQHLFDGRRIIAVVTDGTTDWADGVKDALCDFPCEFVVLPNDPSRREVATHEALFSRLAGTVGPEDVTLYAHGKGTTNHSWPDRGATIRKWTEALYETHMGYWPVVAGVLARSPLAGSLKRRGKFWSESASTWHYSGSWFWFRNADLFGRDWRRIDPFTFGIEPYPSIHFGDHEAGVIWGDVTAMPGESSWPYRAEMWRDKLDADLVAWKHVSAGRRTVSVPAGPPTVTLSVIVPTIGRASLQRTLATLTPQLEPGDEVLVERDQSGDWGATPRQHAQSRAAGRYLLWMDDDDAYLPGALDAVRQALRQAPGRPHLFRLRRGAPHHDLLPAEPVVREGNVSTQMFVAPNDPTRLGRWSGRYEGDYDFIRATLDLYPPDALVWRDEVIAEWRPGTVRYPTADPAADGGPVNTTDGLRQLLADLGQLDRVVEVGAHHGVSTAVLAAHARQVWAVDPWDDPRHYQAFLLGPAGQAVNVAVVRLRSPAAAAAFADSSLDMVYLDGDHDYASVAADIAAWRPKVRPGGWLAGHDFDEPHHPDVARAVRDLLGPPRTVYPDTSWMVQL